MTLRVLQLGAFVYPSHQGSQVYVGGMARALAAAGHEVWLGAYGGGGAPEGVKRLPVPRLPIGPAASGPHWSKLPLDGLLVAAVARQLRRDPPDVIHAHNVEAPPIAWAAMKLARARVPLVYNLHTSLEEELPVYLSERWRPGAARLGRQVDRELARRADATIAISRRAAEVLSSWGARAVHVVGPGVDPEELTGGDAARARSRWSLPDAPLVVYTGNADPYQDLDVLMSAMAQLDGAHLLVVTGSPLEPLRKLASGLGLPSHRLHLVGSTSFPDTLDALAAANLAALPRQVCAGFPIKLLNSLGAGVVTVCAEGSAQPIEGVVTVANGDPSAMAAAMRSLLRAPSMTRRLSAGAVAAVRSRWSWTRRAAELSAVYETVTSSS